MWQWPPTRDMGGVLSLGVIPTAQEYQYCGFDFIIPFASAGVRETLIGPVGANVIPTCSQGTRVWADETGVVGYFLADDTAYDVGLVRSWYDRMKAKTSKPVGSIFWRPPHDTDRNRLISISNFLDFILPYDYPYRDGRSLEATNGIIAYMIALAKDLNCPVILGAQAMDDDFRAMADPGQAGVRNQYEQYHNAGFPIWWYSWTNKVTDVKRNYQNLMHEWYAEEDITTKSIVHTCNAKISYQASSFAENNDALTCPHCGLSLGIEGIKGSEETIEVPEVITPHSVICSKCGSQLELSISSIAEKNIQQYCPVCGEPAD